MNSFFFVIKTFQGFKLYHLERTYVIYNSNQWLDVTVLPDMYVGINN